MAALRIVELDLILFAGELSCVSSSVFRRLQLCKLAIDCCRELEGEGCIWRDGVVMNSFDFCRGTRRVDVANDRMSGNTELPGAGRVSNYL